MMNSKKNNIYVIGDSHSLHCFFDYPEFINEAGDPNLFLDGNCTISYLNFETRWLGPLTAYRLERHHDIVMKSLKGLENNLIFFVFGEIDCRIHIYLKHKENHIPLERVIENTAVVYTDYVYKLRKYYNIHLFNIVPTGTMSNNYNYPFYGNNNKRKYITESLNDRLKYHCNKDDIPFIDVYNLLIDENGNRRKELIADGVHLNCEVASIVIEKWANPIYGLNTELPGLKSQHEMTNNHICDKNKELKLLKCELLKTINLRDWINGLKILSKLLKMESHKTEYLLLAGECLMNTCNYKYLIDFFGTLINENLVPYEDQTILMNIIGKAYYRQGKYTDAENTFKQILTNNPDNTEAIYNKKRLKELILDQRIRPPGQKATGSTNQTLEILQPEVN